MIFLISNALSGVGGGIYMTLGAVYVDDNVKKSKAPLMLCLASFVRLLAPALGYSLASFCVKIYVAPSLHPKISEDDPRWIGAWWIGYVIIAAAMFLIAPVIATFPKTLPRAALRKKIELMKRQKSDESCVVATTKTSISGK